LLRRALWKRGHRYRLHPASLPGRPDIIFGRCRVAIFCDGDFWHGKNWAERRVKLARGANAGYWTAKIEANMRRDHVTAERLAALGWTVLRFWESEIRSNVAAVVAAIEREIGERKGRLSTSL
jgi:DNA mismatch endonuclease (patch repair protein)